MRFMRKEYDFSKGIKNPHADKTKAVITIRLEKGVIRYFKDLSEKLGIPYQILINSYLVDCVTKKKTPKTTWS